MPILETIATFRKKITTDYNDAKIIKKIAIILLVIGIILPSITGLLSQPTSLASAKELLFAVKGVKYNLRLDEYELVIYGGYRGVIRYEKSYYNCDNLHLQVGCNKPVYGLKYRLSITYNYILVFSILLLSAGLFLFYRYKKIKC